MRAITLQRGESVPDPEISSVVITEDVTLGGRRIRKGHRLTPDDVPLLADLDRPVHAVILNRVTCTRMTRARAWRPPWRDRAWPFAARPSVATTS